MAAATGGESGPGPTSDVGGNELGGVSGSGAGRGRLGYSGFLGGAVDGICKSGTLLIVSSKVEIAIALSLTGSASAHAKPMNAICLIVLRALIGHAAVLDRPVSVQFAGAVGALAHAFASQIGGGFQNGVGETCSRI